MQYISTFFPDVIPNVARTSLSLLKDTSGRPTFAAVKTFPGSPSPTKTPLCVKLKDVDDDGMHQYPQVRFN